MTHATAHVASRAQGTGADRRVCVLATRYAPVRVVTVATRVKIVSLPKVA